MRIRSIAILLCSILLLSSAAFGSIAYAADTFSSDGVSLSDIRISPNALSGDGEVAVTANISVDTSRAEGGLANVRISGDAVKSSETRGIISIGENIDIGFTITVRSSDLNQPLSLVLLWDGTTSGLPFHITIPSKAPVEPAITFTRTIDKTSVEIGETVAITYTVKNSGSIDISDLVITDAGIGSDFKLDEPSLLAGTTKTKTLNYQVEADFTSAPKLTYHANGKTYTAQCTEKAVKLKVVQLSATLRAILPESVEPGGQVTLVCELQNAGSVKITGITIDEPTLGSKLFTAQSLDKGESMQFSKTVTLMHTNTFQYSITAKDDSGNPVTVKTNQLQIVVSSGNDQYDIEIRASPDLIQLAEPGIVSFEITITNKGAAPVEHATITGTDGEKLEEDFTLPVGVSKWTWVSSIIDKTTSFAFTLSVTDGKGGYLRSTDPYEVKVANPLPTATASSAPSEAPGQSPGTIETDTKPVGSFGDIFRAMIVVGGLIVVTIIVLIVMLISDKLKRKNTR